MTFAEKVTSSWLASELIALSAAAKAVTVFNVDRMITIYEQMPRHDPTYHRVVKMLHLVKKFQLDFEKIVKDTP